MAIHSRLFPVTVLGTDVPEIMELLQETQLEAQVNNTAPTFPMDKALAVETRAQARRRERAAVIETLKELTSPAHLNSFDGVLQRSLWARQQQTVQTQMSLSRRQENFYQTNLLIRRSAHGVRARLPI